MSPPENNALSTVRYVLLERASQLTGYTVKAMQRKIERGEWRDGELWRKAPDGRIHVDMENLMRWVSGSPLKEAK